MRINPVAFGISNNNKPAFKAEVEIGAWNIRDNQPSQDRIALEEVAKSTKERLEKIYPDKNDNIKIVLQPYGYYVRDTKSYLNGIDAYVGYKKHEVARQYIIDNNNTNEWKYPTRLDDEDMCKLRDRDAYFMSQLQKPVYVGSTSFEYPYLKIHLEDDVIKGVGICMKDLPEEILFQLPDPPPKEPEPPDNRAWYDKACDWLIENVAPIDTGA